MPRDNEEGGAPQTALSGRTKFRGERSFLRRK
jgi:hypothetical protein